MRQIDRNRTSVLVTSIQTLDHLIERGEHDFLAGAKVLVVDEAHHSVAPTDTKLFQALDNHERDERLLVIGMTATPYRGFNDEESQRLKKRYEGHLVPVAQEQPGLYECLRQDGILARPRWRELQGVDLRFTDDDVRCINEYNQIPPRALNELAGNRERTDRVVEEVLALGPARQVLVFALSPGHAQELAALLNVRGCPAAAVLGTTPPGQRRFHISEFMEGRLRALTTVQVLTTGFDAPKVDTIVVARPTFSTVLFQQMIGRGMRGEKMGGTAVCEVITVRDNLDQFEDRLAWHYFKDLWS